MSVNLIFLLAFFDTDENLLKHGYGMCHSRCIFQIYQIPVAILIDSIMPQRLFFRQNGSQAKCF